jgi:hypothetical protein
VSDDELPPPLTLHRLDPQASGTPFELPRPPDFPAHGYDLLVMVDNGEHYLRCEEAGLEPGMGGPVYRWSVYTFSHELTGTIAYTSDPVLPAGVENLVGMAVHHLTCHGVNDIRP